MEDSDTSGLFSTLMTRQAAFSFTTVLKIIQCHLAKILPLFTFYILFNQFDFACLNDL